MATNLHELALERNAAKKGVDELNKELSEAKKVLTELDDRILSLMTDQKLDRVALEGVTISVSKQTVFNPTDWTEFNEYAAANGLNHLYQRRLTQKAVEEALALDANLPVNSFTKRSLNVRKV